MDIYDRINILLIEKKKNKRKMSIDLQMPYSTLSSLFIRRSTNVDIQIMKKIANYLGTTLEYLINGDEKYKYGKDEKFYSKNTIIVIKDNDNVKYYKFNDDDFNAILTIINKFHME